MTEKEMASRLEELLHMDIPEGVGKAFKEKRKRKHKFHKQNCNSTVRATIKCNNTTISLVGTHAFEWSIIKEMSGKVIITTFPKRENAINEFKKYKSK